MTKRTELGIYLRIIRAKRNETLQTMADKIGVSSSFLSAVEVGKKDMPLNRLEMIVDLYDIKDLDQVKRAYILSKNKVTFRIRDLPEKHKELFVILSENIENLPEEKVEKILQIIKE